MLLPRLIVPPSETRFVTWYLVAGLCWGAAKSPPQATPASIAAAGRTNRAIRVLTLASLELTGHSVTARVNDRKLLPPARDCSPLSDAEFQSALRLLQPEMQSGIRAPRLPALRAGAQCARPAHACSALERAIRSRERVRPVERAHYDLGCEPIADAFDRRQRAVRRDNVAPRLQNETAVGDRARGGYERKSATGRDAERLETRGARFRDPIRGGCESIERGGASVDRVAERADHALHGIAGRCPRRSRTANQRAENDVEAVERSRNANAVCPGDERCQSTLFEMRIDQGRFGVEVEQLPQTREEWHERRQKRERDLDVEMRTQRRGRARRRIRCENHAAPTLDADGAPVARALHELDPGNRIAVQELQEHVPGERCAVGECQPNEVPHRIGRRHRRVVYRPAVARLDGPSQAARAQAVTLAKHRVEAAQALKAAGEGDMRYRQRRVGEQALCEQQPMRLCKLDGRYADLALESTTQVSLADVELSRQVRHGATVERAGADANCCREGEARNGVDRRLARSELGAAAQAGAISRTLGRRGGHEEATMTRNRDSRRADRPAIDPGRDDADEEDAVEARIVRPSCTLALVRVEQEDRGDGAGHAANLHACGTLTSRIRTWNRGAPNPGY